VGTTLSFGTSSNTADELETLEVFDDACRVSEDVDHKALFGVRAVHEHTCRGPARCGATIAQAPCLSSRLLVPTNTPARTSKSQRVNSLSGQVVHVPGPQRPLVLLFVVGIVDPTSRRIFWIPQRSWWHAFVVHGLGDLALGRPEMSPLDVTTTTLARSTYR
jgi:hypothetical protein